MKRLTMKRTASLPLIALVGGLAFLLLILAAAGEKPAQADPGTTVGIDVDPYNTPANTPATLGSIQACLSVTGGAPFDIDVYAKDIPDPPRLKGWELYLQFDPSLVTIPTGGNDVFQLLDVAPGSSVEDYSEPTPDTDGFFYTGAFDWSEDYDSHESGNGVLTRITLQASATNDGIADLELFFVDVKDTNGDPITLTAVYDAAVGVDVPMPDTDGDTICDAGDNCPQDPNPLQEDGDSDGWGDACDVCPALYNPGQEDDDGDDRGDICDNCPWDANNDQSDMDGDAIWDDDMDGMYNEDTENGVDDDGDTLRDEDGGGGDVCDFDIDGDGFWNTSFGIYRDTEGYWVSDPYDAASTPEMCDGIDNDGDGRIDEDHADDDGDTSVDEELWDNIDDDNDGMEDGSGPKPFNGDCSDSIDNDGDTKTDVFDLQCKRFIDEDTGGPLDDEDYDGAREEDETDATGTDNDGDTLVNEGWPDHDLDGTPDCLDPDTDTDGDGVTNVIDRDDDNDGAPDWKENWVGTDPLNDCPNSPDDPAWLPDIDNSAWVTVLDIAGFRLVLGSVLGGTSPSDHTYNRRYDLKPDGWINILDVAPIVPYLGIWCTP